MITIISQNIRTFLCVLTVVFATNACTPKPHSVPPTVGSDNIKSTPDVNLPPSSGIGKEDGGGGFTLFSTQAEVRAAIDKSWRYVLHPNAETNPFGRLSEWYKDSGDGNSKVRDMMKKMFYTNADHRIYKNFWDYLQKSGKLNVTDKSCEVGHQAHTDASVSQNRIGATICISATSLQRIPSYLLVNEILGLLVHEIAHINGYNEGDAQEIQRVAAPFFAGIASGTAAAERRSLVKNHIDLSESQLRSIFEIAAFDGRDPNVLNALKTTTLLLGQIPKFKDSVHLELTLNVENVTTCSHILETIEKIEKDLNGLILKRADIRPDSERPEFYDYQSESHEVFIIKPENWDKSLAIMIDSLESIEKIHSDLDKCFTNKKY